MRLHIWAGGQRLHSGEIVSAWVQPFRERSEYGGWFPLTYEVLWSP